MATHPSSRSTTAHRRRAPSTAPALRALSLVARIAAAEGRRPSPEQLRAVIQHLQAEVISKDEDLGEMESNLEMALTSIKTFHEQQRQLSR